MKVERRDSDVYCFVPSLELHLSLHKSGELHFKQENKIKKVRKEPPVILQMGAAGVSFGDGIKSSNLNNLGCASGICIAIFPINNLNDDFQEFRQSQKECFKIDKSMFPSDVTSIEIGVWAVPSRNEVSFKFNKPDIHKNLLYKVTSCEPQIWIYAEPSNDFN